MTKNGEKIMPESRILMVDDNPEIREVVSVLLEGEGFVIDEAQSGRAALDYIKNILMI